VNGVDSSKALVVERDTLTHHEVLPRSLEPRPPHLSDVLGISVWAVAIDNLQMTRHGFRVGVAFDKGLSAQKVGLGPAV
jgi:hypothetical protein